MVVSVPKKVAAPIFRVEIGYSEMVIIYIITLCRNSEDHNLNEIQKFRTKLASALSDSQVLERTSGPFSYLLSYHTVDNDT
jgi:hypothetical protein